MDGQYNPHRPWHLCHWVPCASQENRLLGERSSPQLYLGVKCKVFPGERSLGVKILGFAIRLCWGRDSPCTAQADTLENLFSWLSKQRCTLHVEFVPCHSAGTLPSLHALTRCVLFGHMAGPNIDISNDSINNPIASMARVIGKDFQGNYSK